MIYLKASIISARQLDYQAKRELYPYGRLDWEGESYFTEVLSETVKPKWKKGTFHLPFTGSLRNQILPVSVYSCDPTEKGNDKFLGQAIIDLYTVLPFDLDETRSRAYDDWIRLDGGPSPEAVVRVQLVVVKDIDKPAIGGNASSEGLLDEVSSEKLPDSFQSKPLHSVLVPKEESRGALIEEKHEEASLDSDAGKASAQHIIEDKSRIKSQVYSDLDRVEPRRLSNSSTVSLNNESTVTSTLIDKPFTLTLQFLRARDILPRDPLIAATKGPFPNVYCYIDNMMTTTAVERFLAPKWLDETYQQSIGVADFEAPICVHIQDYDAGADEDIGSLGVVMLDLCSLPLHEVVDKWYKIRDGTGELRIAALLEGDPVALKKQQEVVFKKTDRLVDKVTKGEDTAFVEIDEAIVNPQKVSTKSNAHKSGKLQNLLTVEGKSALLGQDKELPPNKREHETILLAERPELVVHSHRRISNYAIPELNIRRPSATTTHFAMEQSSAVIDMRRPTMVIMSEGGQGLDYNNVEGVADFNPNLMNDNLEVVNSESESSVSSSDGGSDSSATSFSLKQKFDSRGSADSDLVIMTASNTDFRRVQSQKRHTPQATRHRRSVVTHTYDEQGALVGAHDIKQRPPNATITPPDSPNHTMHELPLRTGLQPPNPSPEDPWSDLPESRRISVVSISSEVFNGAMNDAVDVYDKTNSTTGVNNLERPKRRQDMSDHQRRLSMYVVDDVSMPLRDQRTMRFSAKKEGLSKDTQGISVKARIQEKSDTTNTGASSSKLAGDVLPFEADEEKNGLLGHKNHTATTRISIDQRSTRTAANTAVISSASTAERQAPLLKLNKPTNPMIFVTDIPTTSTRLKGSTREQNFSTFDDKITSSAPTSREDLRNRLSSVDLVKVQQANPRAKLTQANDVSDNANSKDRDLPLQLLSSDHRKISVDDNRSDVGTDQRLAVNLNRSGHDTDASLRDWQEDEATLTTRLCGVFTEVSEEEIIRVIKKAKGRIAKRSSKGANDEIFDEALRIVTSKVQTQNRQVPSPGGIIGVEKSTRKKRALLIGCNYYNLDPKNVLHRVVQDEIKGIMKMLSDSFDFPTDESSFAIMSPDATPIPTKKEILRITYGVFYQKLEWLTSGATKGDSLVLFFTGYRTFIPYDVDGVMLSEDGEEIIKEEMYEHLYNRIPAGCRLTCLMDYHNRLNENFTSDGSQTYHEESLVCPADVRIIALNGQCAEDEELRVNRNPMALSLCTVMAKHPEGLSLSQVADNMSKVALSRGFKHVKPVITTSQPERYQEKFTFLSDVPAKEVEEVQDILTQEIQFKHPSFEDRTSQDDSLVLNTAVSPGEIPHRMRLSSPRGKSSLYDDDDAANDIDSKSKDQQEKRSVASNKREDHHLIPPSTSFHPRGSKRLSEVQSDPEEGRRGQAFSLTGDADQFSQTVSRSHHNSPRREVYQVQPDQLIQPHHHHVITTIVKKQTNAIPHHHHQIVTRIRRQVPSGPPVPMQPGYYRLPPPGSY